MIKKIEAIIRSEKLSSTIKELSAIGIVGLTIQPVKGRGRGVGMQLQWRGTLYNVDLLPRTMITTIVSEGNVDETVQAIMRGAPPANTATASSSSHPWNTSSASAAVRRTARPSAIRVTSTRAANSARQSSGLIRLRGWFASPFLLVCRRNGMDIGVSTGSLATRSTDAQILFLAEGRQVPQDCHPALAGPLAALLASGDFSGAVDRHATLYPAGDGPAPAPGRPGTGGRAHSRYPAPGGRAGVTRSRQT